MHSVSDALLVLEELLGLDVYHGHQTVDPDAVAALLLSCAQQACRQMSSV